MLTKVLGIEAWIAYLREKLTGLLTFGLNQLRNNRIKFIGSLKTEILV